MQFERSQKNWAQVHNQLVHEEAEANARMKRAQQAKLRQIKHFQRREKENQEKKQKKDTNAEQQLALYRSRVFPWLQRLPLFLLIKEDEIFLFSYKSDQKVTKLKK